MATWFQNEINKSQQILVALAIWLATLTTVGWKLCLYMTHFKMTTSSKGFKYAFDGFINDVKDLTVFVQKLSQTPDSKEK